MNTKLESSSDKGKRKLENGDNSGSYYEDLKRSEVCEFIIIIVYDFNFALFNFVFICVCFVEF